MAVRRRARCLYPARAVSQALSTMAASLTPLLADRDPVVLAVMHGGVFTAVELSRRFRFPHELDYVHVTRYGGELTGGELEWRVRPSSRLAGRTVLVVDDILDHGHTLAALLAELEAIGVAQCVTAVLVEKRRGRRVRRPHVDVVGLTIDDVYVFGCGMDYRGYWRELRGLYAVDGDE